MSIRRKNNKVLLIHLVLDDRPQKNLQSDLYATDGGKRKKRQTGKVKKAKEAAKEEKKLKEAMKFHIEQEQHNDPKSEFKTPAHQIYYPFTSAQIRGREYDDDQRFDLDDTPEHMRQPNPNATHRRDMLRYVRAHVVDKQRRDRERGNSTIVRASDGKSLPEYQPRRINYDAEE